MIDPKELRMGNLVMANGKQGIVWGVSMSGIVWVKFGDNDSRDFSFEELESIPLTPEWLERLGLREKEPNRWYIDSDLFIEKNYQKDHPAGKAWIISLDFDGKCPLITALGFVHEAQNKVFALTGQELTVKEKETCEHKYKLYSASDFFKAEFKCIKCGKITH